MDVPEEYGGGGVEDFAYNLIISEEMAAAGAGGAGLGITLHNDVAMPYFRDLTNDEQKQRWLPAICSGEAITAIAMTEPGMGSDLASMGTTAIRDGDVYVVNGSKTFITNGINADLVITAVKTDPSQRHRGMSLIVIERGMEGFERGRNLDKVGMHSQDTAELFFNDVRVPVANRLGEEGEGFLQLVTNLPRNDCRSRSPASPPPAPRSIGRSPTRRSGWLSANRSAASRTAGSHSPRWRRRSASARSSSIGASRR